MGEWSARSGVSPSAQGLDLELLKSPCLCVKFEPRNWNPPEDVHWCEGDYEARDWGASGPDLRCSYEGILCDPEESNSQVTSYR